MRTLFGRPVFIGDPDLTLTDQIYEILCEEIRSGHWQIGERLPSTASLSNQSGLGRTPIQQAFDRLSEAGYVRQEQRSGTFLKCRFPKGTKNFGAIGVALYLAEDEGHVVTDPYSHFRLGRLLAAISERGYAADVRYLRTQEEWDNVDVAGKVFGEQVRSVVSLHACDHESAPALRPGRLPFVHVGSTTRRCQPVVAGDTAKGFYDATVKLIALGHRGIACFMDPAESDEENAVRMEAHEAAMSEAGLSVMRQAAIDSYKVSSSDILGLRHWLDTCAAATAIICMRGAANTPLINVARLLGRSIPDDLSLIGHGEHPGNPEFPVTRVDYDYASLVSASLDLLADQMRTRRVTVSRILIRAFIREGVTIAACRQQNNAQSANS